LNFRISIYCAFCLVLGGCALGNHYGGAAGEIVVNANDPGNIGRLRAKYGKPEDLDQNLVEGNNFVEEQTYELYLVCRGEKAASPYTEIHVGDSPVHLTFGDCSVKME
jgi:hypothetical protein